jgi:hypothetical protein
MSPWGLVKKLYGDIRVERVAKFRGAKGVRVIGLKKKRILFFIFSPLVQRVLLPYLT